jgi:glutathione synthase/RimK-type ligase-like ATP-grasp enzyme
VKPVVLLATARRWPPVARLAMALVNAGFLVEVICPRNHPVTKTRVITQTFPYSGIAPLDSFAAAISAVKPDLIIPGDDVAAEQLHALYSRESTNQDHGADSLCSLLARSLGSPESYAIVHERSTFIQAAGQEGVRVPKTTTVSNFTELQNFAQQFGFPMVLKANGTSGGEGVRVVRSLDEAGQTLRTLQAPPFWARALKRAILDADTTLIRPCLARRRFVVNAQSYVNGQEATSLVACWRGQVLAALHFEVLNKGISAGPASVLRIIENDEMSNTAEKVVRRLNLSGLQGFDFMLEAKTGHAYLIEINPRSTQVGHLTLGPGRDLPAALYSALTGTALREAPKVTEKDTIALFPQEWVRDSKSEYLKVAYHDVPWEEPELVNTCIRMSRKWTSRTSQQDRIKAFWLLADSANENPKEALSQPLVAEQGKS